MRQHFAYQALLALLLTAAFAGCQREPLPESGGAVSFSVAPVTISGEVTKAATKADPTAKTDLIAVNNKVTVYGSYTAAGSSVALFDGVTLTCTEVSATGSTWTYSPLKYWSEDATHKFRAVFPYDVDGKSYSVADDKLSVSGYSMGGDDLMVASAQQKAASRESNTVKLQFRHACAAVSFQFAKAKGDTETYSITGITLQDVSTTGDMADDETNPTKWTPNTTPGSSYTWTGGPWTVAESTTESPVTYTAITPEWVFAVPQTLPSTSSLILSYAAGTAPNVQNITVTIPLVSTNTTKISTWEPGKKYTYKVLVDPNAIRFNVEISEDWIDETKHEYEPVG